VGKLTKDVSNAAFKHCSSLIVRVEPVNPRRKLAYFVKLMIVFMASVLPSKKIQSNSSIMSMLFL
jgi:hypothetical protein